MNVKEAIFGRRSVRKYTEDPVPEQSIREMLEAARQAPSGTNSQPWRFVVIRSEEKRRQLRKGTVQFIANAPVVIACCIDVRAYENSDKLLDEMKALGVFDGVDIQTEVHDDYVDTEVPMEAYQIKSYCLMNSAFAIENLVLRAHDLGLGTCIAAMYNQKVVRDILELDEHQFVSMLVSVGVPAESPPARPRIPMETLLLKEI